MIVVDASVLVVALADDGAQGSQARRRLRGQRLVAPELVDLEVASVLRRLVATGSLAEQRAVAALDDLMDLPLMRVGHRRLLHRCWRLGANLTVYDAAYVAAAEVLSVPLLTADGRMAEAPGIRCTVEVLQPAG